jgi:hypothetical protein
MQQDIQQVCENGHQITDRFNSSSEQRKNFCSYCGAKTITACPECNHPIKGYIKYPKVIMLGYTTSVPNFCDNCGKPYPWQAKKTN